jgi:hypothetical protein
MNVRFAITKARYPQNTSQALGCVNFFQVAELHGSKMTK